MPWGPSAVMRSFFGTEGLGPPRSILQLEKSQAAAVEQIFLASTRPRMRRSPPTAFLYPLNVLRKLAGQVRSWFTPFRRVVQGHEARPLCGRPLIGLRPSLILGQREQSRLKERMAKAVAAALQTPRDLELDAGLPQPPIADVRCAHRRQAAARDDLGREPSV
jgi:hypothetical protein